MNSSAPITKPHKEYSRLVDLLSSRGMRIPNQERAERKLAQIGYYRLSGFWYPCRFQSHDPNVRLDDFQPNTDFDRLIDLYLFDKKLRFLILDAIERIEIHLRSVIAHELGREDPLAYKNKNFIHKPDKSQWGEWQEKHKKLLLNCKEDAMRWHRNNNRAIPFWVAVEAWDFGLMSKYYKMLKKQYQVKVASRLQIDNTNTLAQWLESISILRNRCAHHTRTWNQYNQINKSHIPVLSNDYFTKLNLDDHARQRLYGIIAIIWFLVSKIGSNSDWIRRVADVFDSKPTLPGCTYWSMGLSDDKSFPRSKFGLT